MNDIHPDLIEKYQLILERDPRSQVFAPLSEAYRKMGLLEEAFRISSRGVQFHPHFASGHIALAQVLMEKGQLETAKQSFEKATELSQENILAYQKLGECCLKLRQGKEALKAFKMVLLFSPLNERARQVVQKLETLTADEFEDDMFQMNRLNSLSQTASTGEELEIIQPATSHSQVDLAKELDRKLSLLEAYSVRGQMEEAYQLAEDLRQAFPHHKTVQKRLESLSQDQEKNEFELKDPPEDLQRSNLIREEKLKLLRNLLIRIREEHDPGPSLG